MGVVGSIPKIYHLRWYQLSRSNSQRRSRDLDRMQLLLLRTREEQELKFSLDGIIMGHIRTSVFVSEFFSLEIR
ncbi:hypothetical protein I7I50_06432 [Histoplasma capsulatum G186AR]|uniref:Uncharacterized protein n=1 Tax=Ajellomyces capsulatus TaxID=5037 RepID=A0A8H7YZE3_AJECA|nr:hypothetical protein I7I52_10496 [Histoplasma capsulatum]QSS67381.1 hypothetical protein I7I50_06432 [Histoplasma capsulatum G186AR]